MKHSYKKVERLVKTAIKANRVPFIWGPPGIGKSSLAKKIANDLGMNVKILDAALFEPTDFMIPKIEKSSVKFYTHDFFLEENTLILIDDLPHAKPYQMIPLFQLVLDRRIGNIKLPESVRFIVTGNREEDLAEVSPIPSPLLNRFIHFELEADLDEWFEWAVLNDIDNRIIAFLQAYPQEFVQTPKEGIRTWATPRSWHALSDLLKVDDESIFELSIGTVGESAGSLFTTFCKLFMNLDPEKLLSTEPKFESKKEMYAAIMSVVQYLSTKNKNYISMNKENIRKFYNSLSGEYRLLFGRAFRLFSLKNPIIVTEVVKAIPELQEKIKEYI